VGTAAGTDDLRVTTRLITKAPLKLPEHLTTDSR
jgi:hypothetical protein